MSTFILKRKLYGLSDAVGQTASAGASVANNAINAAGNIAKGAIDTTKNVAGAAIKASTPVMKPLGAFAGAKFGSAVGSLFGPLGTAVGAVGGFLAGPKMMQSATKSIGNALQK